jgi:hypothetical protein
MPTLEELIQAEAEQRADDLVGRGPTFNAADFIDDVRRDYAIIRAADRPDEAIEELSHALLGGIDDLVVSRKALEEVLAWLA